MSLTEFVERPAMREAFKNFALPTKELKSSLPIDFKNQPLLVPSCGRYQTSVGTSFDYLARFRIAREIYNSADKNIAIYDNGWIAEKSLQIMSAYPAYRAHFARWEKIVNKARELFSNYMQGKDIPVERIAKCCQYLANLDLLYRIGEFNPNFQAPEQVHQELISLNEHFDPLIMLKPRKQCILNPWFNLSDLVKGADADLFTDDCLLDFKTLSEINLNIGYLRQLAGYAVLTRLGGFNLKNTNEQNQSSQICNKVALYFSRHATLLEFDINFMFPNDNFEKFTKIFLQETKQYKIENTVDTNETLQTEQNSSFKF